ncbi:MAG TPA: class I tRNA ligase family protein [Phycisphaerae bacterium]|nr:class I tRNA ligase family protein [Phycisphaerae bacterium]
MTESASSYKETLNLPKTTFEMKANLTQREPAMLKGWQETGLYGQIRGARKGAKKWVLHDGPPYANGDIHIGHLINKVLKDIVVKFRTMEGFDSPYVPGWDCHGLPIESAIQKELGPKFRELTKEEVRKRCAAYAMKYVKLQGDSFQRLGVLGEFARPYLTLDPAYEGGILEVLGELVKRDLVYRQKKPVHWCVNDRTALAEAELEYVGKRDTSVYVNFELADLETWCPEEWRGHLFGAFNAALYPNGTPRPYLMIWTTTPWTLPANRAVAIHPDHEYVAARFMRDKGTKPEEEIIAIVAAELVGRVAKTAGYEAFGWCGKRIKGRDLVARLPKYRHPLDPSRVQPVVLADYVTLEDGTGLVHTAPGHGKEDYQTGMKHGLEVYNPVLADGRYDETVPEFLRGKLIWDANALVIEKLRENGALFHAQEFEHEYPHCWRCKKPVIFRATEQWFVKASGEQQEESHKKQERNMGGTPMPRSPLWENAKKFVDRVTWVPGWGRNRIEGMLDTRPDWCISRQRSWGVPIPAFFDGKGRTLLTAESVARVAKYFAKHGADSWYTDSAARILGLEKDGGAHGPAPSQTAGFGEGLRSLGFPADVEVDTLEKGMDILDVWFESGASHHAVLECTHPELGYPAAMYLEGSDQHRGWFQSSLLEAAGYKAEPPFKEVLTHGFAVDEKGLKYSKSSGNYVPLEQLLKQHGADVLRLWVCSVDYQNDIRFGPNLLATISDAYRKIRNTMRYLLGNLYDFDPTEHSVDAAPQSIDLWMRQKVDAWAAAVHAAYGRYEFHTAFKLIYEFCNVEISATYAKAIKDRLYCELPDSERRRASQTVCYRALLRLIELCAPVLVYTADEAWGAVRKLPGCGELEASVHLAKFSFLESAEGEGAEVDEEAAGEELAMELISTLTEGLRETVDAAAAMRHWEVLWPLIEKGNKQLDDLKRGVGLGNPLDAEAVIVLPAVADELSRVIEAYGPEIEDALGVGYHRFEHGEVWDLKINDTRNVYASCARSWKRRPDVGADGRYPELSARDARVVAALREGK